MVKICTMIYVHSELGQNNFIRGYCHAFRKLLVEDRILAEMIIQINGDDPKIKRWLSRNTLGVVAPNPGFIIKLPKCAQLKYSGTPIMLDIGFATQAIEIAYAIYGVTTGKEPGDPPQIYTKPLVLETDEICALTATIESLPAVIGK